MFLACRRSQRAAMGTIKTISLYVLLYMTHNVSRVIPAISMSAITGEDFWYPNETHAITPIAANAYIQSRVIGPPPNTALRTGYRCELPSPFNPPPSVFLAHHWSSAR